MKKQTQADILKVLGGIIFVAGVFLSYEWFETDRTTAMDLYFLGIWFYLGAIATQTAED